MFVKFLALSVLAVIIIYGVYLLGMVIYNHFISERVKQTRALKNEIERLESILEREKKNEA